MIEITGTTVLVWGFVLAAINYYLGAFLGSAPLPKKVRSIGWAMVEDSATYSLLLAVCATPLTVLRIFSSIGFGNADALYEQTFYPWLGIREGLVLKTGMFSILVNGLVCLALILFMLTFIGILIHAAFRSIVFVAALGFGLIPPQLLSWAKSVSVVVVGIFNVYVWYRTVHYAPFLALMPVAAFTLYAVYYLAEFIRTYWASMLGLGALIFGAPFRVGRRLGAALIAISLVFYIGLPLMPYFVEPIAKLPSAAEALERLRSDLNANIEAAAVSGLRPAHMWPTTRDELNASRQLYEGEPVKQDVPYINLLFNLATGADVKNATEIAPTVDPPEYIKRIAVPEGLTEFTFYTILLPNIYIWAILAMIAAGLARLMAGKGL